MHMKTQRDPMTRSFASPLCASKQKGLAINSENLAKIYIIETKMVSSFSLARQRKNAGGKNEGIFHYVIENKCCKNVRNRPLHYVDENKDGYSRLSIMLMKIKQVTQKQGQRGPVTMREPAVRVRSPKPRSHAGSASVHQSIGQARSSSVSGRKTSPGFQLRAPPGSYTSLPQQGHRHSAPPPILPCTFSFGSVRRKYPTANCCRWRTSALRRFSTLSFSDWARTANLSC